MSDSATSEFEQCYRPRRYYLRLGVTCVVFFSLVGIVFTSAAYWNIDGSFPRPELAAFLISTFSSVATCLSFWIILAYYREQLFISGAIIVQSGVVRTKVVQVDDISHFKWHAIRYGGCIVVQTATQKMKVYLDNFSTEEHDEIVAFMHESVANELQDGWSEFDKVTRRLSEPPKPPSPAFLVVVAMLFLAMSGAFFYCWWRNLGTQYLVIGVINLLAALWYLRRLRHLPEKSLE